MNFELQKILWDRGGYLIWGFFPLLDGLGKNVGGVVPNPNNVLSNFSFQDYWLEYPAVRGADGRQADPIGPSVPAVAPGPSPGLGFLGRRTAAALLTLLIVSILIFVGTTVLPGERDAILGRTRPRSR